jgi:adenylate kinase family enzyme
MPSLANVGSRIMICGPSNSGKSTLAVALGRKLHLPVVHLDRFRHLPDTDWQQRSDVEFRQLHDAAILGDAWIIDGNYSSLMPQRFARATGIILLHDSRWANLRRYLWRTVMQRHRAGNLEGGRDSLKWTMVHWIIVVSPGNVARYRAMLPKTGLPLLEIGSMRELKRVHAGWDL